LQVRTAPMQSKSGKILMSLNSKQKLLCQLATTELYSNETKKRVTARKWQKRVWIWCLKLVSFGLSNHTDPCFLASWSPPAQEKVFFQVSKELKMN